MTTDTAILDRPAPCRAQKIFGIAGSYRHPLLKLLPYPKGTDALLDRLNASLLVAFDPDAPRAERIDQDLELGRGFEPLYTALPDGAALYAEVLGILAPVLRSPRLYEALGDVHLAADNLTVVEEASGQVPLLRLRRRAKLSFGQQLADEERILGLEAQGDWSEGVGHLEERSLADLSSLPVEERISGLRLLQLFVRYCVGRHELRETERRRRRREYFEGIGLGLWQALLTNLPALDQTEQERLERFGGEAVRNLIGHELRPDVEAPAAVPESGSTAGVDAGAAVPVGPGWHVVVTAPIPPATSPDDRTALERYERLRRPLPVARLPEPERLARIERTLAAEYPWAVPVVEELCGELRARRFYGGVEMGLSPLLLVGQPGCGKSRLVRRLAEELGLAFHPLALSGMSDSKMLVGTSRGWSSGQPSPLVTALLAAESASLLVMLDEIDKPCSALSANSVPPTTALLNLLEPETARRWMDEYLQVACDLRHLLFCATANGLAAIPKPLLSRLRIVHMPSPRRSDLPAIARTALRDLEKELGLPEGVLPAVDLDRLPPRMCSAREVRLWVRHAIVGAAQNGQEVLWRH